MKKMRNWGTVLLAFVLGCIIVYAALPSREDKIVAFVRENEIELTAIAEKRLAGDYTVKNYKNAKVDGVFPNTAKGDIVQFNYAGE
nr:hypothetical protein [Lachnospiraceae bacterium]